MITKTRLISDIILQLTQGVPTDDFTIEELQVAQWLDYHLNDLIKREITDHIKTGMSIPPIYIIRETGLTMTEEAVIDIDDHDQRFYLTLTNEVLDLPKDSGVVKVLDYDLNLIHKTASENLEVLRDLRFAKPSTENVLYYREGKKVFIEGFNTADVDFNDLIVFYVPKQDILSMADGDEVIISDQLIPVLIDMCVQRGKLQLYGTQPDTSNDGVDRKQVQYHTAISNPTNQDQQAQTQEQ